MLVQCHTCAMALQMLGFSATIITETTISRFVPTHLDISPQKMPLTVGYHLIRGLGAPLRMMCHYKNTSYNNV